ncbi:diguanylate cyclase (plasmid) [Acaryochloris sp. 'Moss Beach']|uniref:GGDEF domain-containing response regulator n=1 Tax=Acaryochloris sp. 'Moss Beach' TaxID=2740837 RepID=UPI001F27DBD2|nr:diguanylate cyclase [Acaryochloris sp. 'Moss Beach']UJB72463.1 diguanylate cyclase [Acaryochloris sp. 'Moss Beach']
MQIGDTRILMIEDDKQDVEIIKELLEGRHSFSATLEHRKTLAEGIARLHHHPAFDLILLDLSLTDAHGLEAFQQIQLTFPEMPLIILSGNLDPLQALHLLQHGAQDCLFKGHFDATVLCCSIQFALERQNLRSELREKNESLKKISKELTIANRKLENIAVIDSLTKISNRRRFDTVFMSEWVRLMREGQPLSLILCDVDHFKAYNDTYGHPAGDHCLQQVAHAIKTVAKRPADCVARYGGEEFAVVLPNTDQSGAVHVAEAIRAEIEALHIPHISSSVGHWISLSLGVASVIPKKEIAPSQLIELADQSLYMAKEQGRNCLHFFQPIQM